MPIQADGQRLKSNLQPKAIQHHILRKVKILLNYILTYSLVVGS